MNAEVLYALLTEVDYLLRTGTSQKADWHELQRQVRPRVAAALAELEHLKKPDSPL